MFQLTKDEYDNLRSQFATSKEGKGGRRYLPFAFTEHGVIMLSSVLNSKIATQINIAVVKAFIEMRRYIARWRRSVRHKNRLAYLTGGNVFLHFSLLIFHW